MVIEILFNGKKLIFLCSSNFPFEKEVNINVYIIEKILKANF
jgi:hypothetical protein